MHGNYLTFSAPDGTQVTALPIQEAAVLMGMSARALYKRAERGELKLIKHLNRTYVSAEAVRAGLRTVAALWASVLGAVLAPARTAAVAAASTA